MSFKLNNNDVDILSEIFDIWEGQALRAGFGICSILLKPVSAVFQL